MEKRKNISHDLVVESITEALLQLMEKKKLEEISISELCGRAGVSRVSFYRNYSSMEDILVRHLKKCTDLWWSRLSSMDADYITEHFLAELMAQYRENEKLVRLLYNNRLDRIIKEHIFESCDVYSEHPEMEGYQRSLLAGALYGIIDQWARNGMPDFPADMSLQKMISV